VGSVSIAGAENSCAVCSETAASALEDAAQRAPCATADAQHGGCRSKCATGTACVKLGARRAPRATAGARLDGCGSKCATGTACVTWGATGAARDRGCAARRVRLQVRDGRSRHGTWGATGAGTEGATGSVCTARGTWSEGQSRRARKAWGAAGARCNSGCAGSSGTGARVRDRSGELDKRGDLGWR